MADRIVVRGKIKVDARKALHKLRDHMLVDLHLYTTEIARAAAALGATRLDIRWDSSDVVLAFDGRTLEATAIASVRDHVLGGEGQSMGDVEDALRSLGIGITAALGLSPAFVEVTCGGAALRFDASYIEDETSSPPAPENTGSGGWTQVLVRRKVGLETLGRVVRRDTPREVTLLLDATRDAPFVTTLNGVEVPRLRLPPLLTVDLDVPNATRAVLEVHAPAKGARASSVFLERGVRLATYSGVEAWALDDAELPLRVLVDARRLPTNASRSELRQDAELFVRVRDRIPRALEVAVAALSGKAPKDTTKLGHAVEIVDPRLEVHREALGAIAACVAIATHAGKQTPDEARALLEKPLMVDAVGAPLTLARVLEAMKSPPVAVLAAPSCEDAALAPWLGGIPWRRGHAAERVLEGVATAAADALVGEAREGYARRMRALAHPASKPTVARTAACVLVEAFEVIEGPFAGLSGEVAVTRTEGAFKRSGTAHFYVEQRRLESIALPGAVLSVEMALEWPGQIRAKRAYDGVERDPAIERSVLYALRIAALAIAERLEKRDDELVRLAVQTWITTTKQLGDVVPSIEALGRLATEYAWRTSAGELVSLAQIASYAQKTNAICVAPPNSGRAVDGRPVLTEAQAKVVMDLLPAGTALVPYARGLQMPVDVPKGWLDVEAAAMPAFVALTRPNVQGLVGVGPSGLRTYHRGVRLREMPRATAALVVVEDDAAVPTPDWKDAKYTTVVFGLDKEERALVEMVVERCERGDLDYATVADWLGDVKKDLEGESASLVSRITALPQRAKRARLEQQKAAFLAEKPSPEVQRSGPSASVTMPAAGVAVAWLPELAAVFSWTPPPVDVRYHGRHLVDVLVDLPVAAMVDLTRDDTIEDFTRLTQSGLSLVRNAVVSASVELVKDLASRDSFANDIAAMKLCVALLEESPMVAARVDGALRKVMWPTVQGEAMRAGEGEAPCGRNVYPAYIVGEAGSPYDAPAFHLPDDTIGASRRRILAALGLTLRDVTDAIASLQKRRARGAISAPPALPGKAVHPRLRTTLAALGVTAAEGEMELADLVTPSIVCVGENGTAVSLAATTPYPVRVVMRADDADLARAGGEIAAAAEQHLRALMKSAHELPEFMRPAFRMLVCSDLMRDARELDTDALAVFPDTRRVFHRLSELVYAEHIRFTLDPPPHPPHDGEGPILVLTPAEREAVGRHVVLKDVTEELRNELRGAERRAQPPLEKMELSEEQRARCIVAFPFELGPLRGEIGLLAPAHAGLRAIHLHTTNRPLVTFADSGGWPTVAVVNDDTVKPSRAFDGLATQEDTNRIRVAIRQASNLRVTKFLEAPADALGVVRLSMPVLAKSDRVPVLGILWLPAEWPESPAVHLEASQRADPFHVPRASSKVLPVCGRLWIVVDNVQLPTVLEDVFEHVRGRLPAMMKKAVAPEKLAPYQWELRLLGLSDDRDPVKELAADRPDPVLMRVAARRAPHLLQIEPTPPPPPPLELLAENAPVESPPPSSEGFFQGLVRRVIELVTPPKPPPDEALTGALAGAIVAMKLPTTPVAAVVEVHRGRPVRYDAENKRILVNTSHDAVRGLVKHPSRVLFLLAAAVSEVNRELEAVTDAEELAVVRDLLRSDA